MAEVERRRGADVRMRFLWLLKQVPEIIHHPVLRSERSKSATEPRSSGGPTWVQRMTNARQCGRLANQCDKLELRLRERRHLAKCTQQVMRCAVVSASSWYRMQQVSAAVRRASQPCRVTCSAARGCKYRVSARSASGRGALNLARFLDGCQGEGLNNKSRVFGDMPGSR